MPKYNGTEVRISPPNIEIIEGYKNEYEQLNSRKAVAANQHYKHKGPFFFMSYEAVQQLCDFQPPTSPNSNNIKGVVFFLAQNGEGEQILIVGPSNDESQIYFPDDVSDKRIYKNDDFENRVSEEEAITWIMNFYSDGVPEKLKNKLPEMSFSKKQLLSLFYFSEDYNIEEGTVMFKFVIAPSGDENYFSLAGYNNNLRQLCFNCPPDCYGSLIPAADAKINQTSYYFKGF